MIRINLLPWREARRKKQQRDFLNMLAAAALLAFLAVIAVHMEIAGRIEYQEARNQFLRDEIEQLKKIEAQIKEMEKTKTQLLGRLESIQNLQSNRPSMVKIFDELARITPANVFLSSLKGSGNTLVMAGTASSNNIVSEFMRNLANSRAFGVPNLTVIENKDVNGVRASQFELTVIRNQTNETQDGEETQ